MAAVSTGTLTINNSNILYNSGANGGGIYGGPGALTINNSTVSGNSGGNGGGIYGAVTLTISNSANGGHTASITAAASAMLGRHGDHRQQHHLWQ